MEDSTSGGLFLSYRDKTTALTYIQDVLCADDPTETRWELQHMLDVLDQACSRWEMTISLGKSKILSVGVQLEHQPHITLQGQVLEDMESFSYLGSELGQTAKVEREVAVRLEKASKVYQIWREKVFRNRNLS